MLAPVGGDGGRPSRRERRPRWVTKCEQRRAKVIAASEDVTGEGREDVMETGFETEDAARAKGQQPSSG